MDFANDVRSNSARSVQFFNHWSRAMSSRALQSTNTGSLFAAVWVACALLAETMEFNHREIGLVLSVAVFFKFVPMVVTIGALFGRPAFGAGLGIASLFALVGIETTNVLLGA